MIHPDFLERQFWINLINEPICTGSESFKPLSYSPQELETLEQMLLQEGYLKSSGAWDELNQRALHIIERLHEERIPLVFAFVYDALWQLLHKTDPLVTHLLGEEHTLVPHLWVWRIDGKAQQSGWSPHRDAVGTLREDGMPKLLGIWLALTDADIDNACMHCLPAHQDPYYQTNSSESPFLRSKDKSLVQHIRPMPVKAGEFLMWGGELYHWGGMRYNESKPPRVSLTIEWQMKGPAFAQPKMSRCFVPSFEQRLKLCCYQLALHRHMQPIAPEDLSGLKQLVGELDNIAFEPV